MSRRFALVRGIFVATVLSLLVSLAGSPLTQAFALPVPPTEATETGKRNPWWLKLAKEAIPVAPQVLELFFGKGEKEDKDEVKRKYGETKRQLEELDQKLKAMAENVNEDLQLLKALRMFAFTLGGPQSVKDTLLEARQLAERSSRAPDMELATRKKLLLDLIAGLGGRFEGLPTADINLVRQSRSWLDLEFQRLGDDLNKIARLAAQAEASSDPNAIRQFFVDVQPHLESGAEKCNVVLRDYENFQLALSCDFADYMREFGALPRAGLGCTDQQPLRSSLYFDAYIAHKREKASLREKQRRFAAVQTQVQTAEEAVAEARATLVSATAELESARATARLTMTLGGDRVKAAEEDVREAEGWLESAQSLAQSQRAVFTLDSKGVERTKQRVETLEEALAETRGKLQIPLAPALSELNRVAAALKPEGHTSPGMASSRQRSTRQSADSLP